ncbi:hypothetical protein MMC25_006344 [Agyrium rufum]|nr:hypothetical protein [Agyrium rufum]
MPAPGYVFRDGQAIPDSDVEEQKKQPGQQQQTPSSPQTSKALPPTPTTTTTTSSSTNKELPSAPSSPTTASSKISALAKSLTSSSSSTADNGGDPNNPNNKEDVRRFTSNSTTLLPSKNKAPTNSQSPLPSTSTDSHALANADHEYKGAAQVDHFETEVKDLGWNEHPKDVPTPLVGGLPNDELWLLVRRFNKQMYHVKALDEKPLGGLDLNIADEDEFSPDKLRSNIERLYMTVIIGMMGFGKHIARLRSWREQKRTAAFCTVYFVAWIFDLIVPLLTTTLLVLILFPPARPIMFPPAPLALVSSKTGGVQTPAAGVLGSHDSMTGAPEKHQGEAVEQEASNFVSGIASVALSSATGKHEQGDPESDPLNSAVPDPTNAAMVGADAKASSTGGQVSAQHDKTKQPMEEAMWVKMRPVMHIIGDIADGWERFANALSPTHPFPQETPRLKLAAIVAPALLLSLFVTSYMFMKGVTFGVGFGFFGDPLIWRGAAWLNRKFPHWQKLLEIRNTILKGVPTNAQLTITLLRIGEANKAPLPPPPRSDEPPPDKPAELNTGDLALDASHEEIQDAIHMDEPTASGSTTSDSASTTSQPKKKHGSRVLGFLKGTTKAGVESKLGLDKVRAAAGNKHAQNHLGILPKDNAAYPSGPVDFKARYKGKKGWVYISTSATIPCVSFSTHQQDVNEDTAIVTAGARKNTHTDEYDERERNKKLKPVLSIPIAEIRELKKFGGLGWKAKIVVGWATDRSVADGIEIVDVRGERWRFTAVPLREELFNRLVSLGGQVWESY